MIYFCLAMSAVNLYMTLMFMFKLKARIDLLDKKRKWYEIVEEIKVKGADVSYEEVDKRLM